MDPSVLTLVLEQAKKKVKHAQAALLVATQAQQQYQQQLDNLEQYRLDYANKLITRGKVGLNASNFHHLQTFLTQLDQTLSAQRGGLGHFKQQVDACRQAFSQCQQHESALQRLIETQQQQQQQMLDKKEQKLIDELALYSVLRQRNKEAK